jgi:ribonuclease E
VPEARAEATPPAAEQASGAAPRRERPRREERALSSLPDVSIDLAQSPAANEASADEAPAAATARAPVAAPAAPHFELPLQDLQQIADGAGLQWVHSDTDKVLAVQQAIAAEPQPAHVPRERKTVALPDDGPLVLVETRKDLSQLALPFERAAAQGQPRP